MRIWDIVDGVFPEVKITQMAKNRQRISGGASSAVKAVFAVTLAAATAAQVTLYSPMAVVVSGSTLRMVAPGRFSRRPAEQTRAPGASPPTDTQHGQSTAKLAQSFSAFFGEAEKEEPYEDDYAFS